MPILPYAVTSKALPVVLSEPITLKFGMLLLVDTSNEKMSVFCDFIFLTQIVISLIFSYSTYVCVVILWFHFRSYTRNAFFYFSHTAFKQTKMTRKTKRKLL